MAGCGRRLRRRLRAVLRAAHLCQATPLHLAVAGGSLEIVHYMVQHGASFGFGWMCEREFHARK